MNVRGKVSQQPVTLIHGMLTRKRLTQTVRIGEVQRAGFVWKKEGNTSRQRNSD